MQVTRLTKLVNPSCRENIRTLMRKERGQMDGRRLDWLCDVAGLPLDGWRKHGLWPEYIPSDWVRIIVDAAQERHETFAGGPLSLRNASGSVTLSSGSAIHTAGTVPAMRAANNRRLL